MHQPSEADVDSVLSSSDDPSALHGVDTKSQKLQLTGLEIMQRTKSRRRFMKRLLVGGVLTTGVGMELSQSVVSPGQRDTLPSPKLQEVLNILKDEFPDITITYAGLEEERSTLSPSYRQVQTYQPPANQDVQPDSPIQVVSRICHSVSSSDGSISIGQKFDYAANYRLSMDDARSASPEVRDCNDYANWTCELLDKHHVPVYTVSTWTSDPEDGFENWHIFTVCKVCDNKYLIIDNSSTATVWSGSLGSFIAQYSGGTEANPKVRVVPLGMSRYVRPKYNNPLSKLLVQIFNTIDSEQEMKSIGEGAQPLDRREEPHRNKSLDRRNALAQALGRP